MNELLTPNPPGLWPAVWKLLRLRWLIFFSSFRRGKLLRKIGTILVGLLVLSLVGFVFFISLMTLRFMRSPELAEYVGDVTPFIEVFPSLLMGGAFLGILLTSFGVLLQALYLAGDMDFLLALPLSIRAVFVAKLLQAILPNFTLICIFALPVLFGLGVSGNYNLLYYPLVLIVLAALALAAAGISSLLVMLVVRIFPARRVAEVLGFLGAVLSFFCSQSGNLMRFENGNDFDPTQAQALAQTVTRFNVNWSPLTWAGRGLVQLGQGQWLAGTGQVLLVLVLAGLVFGGALLTAERLYYSGWASIQGVQRKKKTARAVQNGDRSRPGFFERLVPASVRAIVVKDFYVERRDLRNMSQLVTPLIFGVIYAFMFLRRGGSLINDPTDMPPIVAEVLRQLSLYINVGLALFVGWMLQARLAGLGISQEGKSYWMLKAAPISPAQLLVAKFTVAYLPPLALGWIFLVIISLIQQVNPLLFFFTLPVVALIIAGNGGLSLAFGVLGAKFDWEDPRQMQKGIEGCLGVLVTMLFLPLSLLLFFGPAIGLKLLGLPEAVGQLAGLLIGGAFCLAATIIPLLLVLPRVPKLGEE